MKSYAIFFNEDGTVVMGTDGITKLDNRLSLENQIIQAENHIHRLRHIKPDMKGFKIIECTHMRDLNKGRILYSTKQ